MESAVQVKPRNSPTNSVQEVPSSFLAGDFQAPLSQPLLVCPFSYFHLWIITAFFNLASATVTSPSSSMAFTGNAWLSVKSLP